MTFTHFLLLGIKYLGIITLLGIGAIVGFSWFLNKSVITYPPHRRYNEFLSSTALELMTLAVGLTLMAVTLIGIDLFILIGIFVYRVITA